MLYKAGPFCADAEGAVHRCSPDAKRTQRSGVHELAYWLRPDRRFCENRFFRNRFLPDFEDDAETCRAEIARRNSTCYLECDTCKAECTSPLAKAVSATYACTAGLPTLGIIGAVATSDAGQDLSYRWGAVRQTGREGVPESKWQEIHETIVQNDLANPRMPRNAISCRKPHRESTVGKFVPSLASSGKPIQRSGFHVPCNVDADCYSRCGEHPVTGKPYVCTKNLRLYTYAGINADGAIYFSDEPGDDRFDVKTNSSDGVLYGTCTDVRMDYMRSGCPSHTSSAPVMGLVGCTGRLGWANTFCGALIERRGPDFTDVGISASSMDYPRTLVPSYQSGGQVVQAVTCSDVANCKDKCARFTKTARANNLPPPEACALCDPPCPTNMGTSLVDTVSALADDIATALRLARTCLGPGGIQSCVCNIFQLLR